MIIIIIKHMIRNPRSAEGRQAHAPFRCKPFVVYAVAYPRIRLRCLMSIHEKRFEKYISRATQ